jgi:hypothetical protein
MQYFLPIFLFLIFSLLFDRIFGRKIKNLLTRLILDLCLALVSSAILMFACFCIFFSFIFSDYNFPRIRTDIDKKYYYIKQETGFAFTSTFLKLRIYEKKTFWFDREIGQIAIVEENHHQLNISDWAAITIQLDTANSLSPHRVIIKGDTTVIMDTTLNFDKKFDIIY